MCQDGDQVQGFRDEQAPEPDLRDITVLQERLKTNYGIVMEHLINVSLFPIFIISFPFKYFNTLSPKWKTI